ncbi:hypothetical protein ACFVR1_18065 [Psychrobacillus sp. NPDC058041]|uniref:hypothetical protein n=1 Tax=Psychrobacillus sp. NPDC058041 TaxID=3346310 RepID=UPI0036D76ADE
MEKPKQNLIKILLIVNLVISTCAAIGVGYLTYKQSTTPDFSEMRSRGGGFPGNGQFQPGQFQPGQDQSDQN